MTKSYTRRAGSWREILEALLHQGVKLFCWRTKARITFANLHLVEREHEPALCLFKTWEEKRAADIPANWRFSLKAAHHVVTNGTKATTKGSTKGIAASMKRIDTGKMAVPLGLKLDSVALETAVALMATPPQKINVRAIRAHVRKLRGPQFDARFTKTFSGKVVPRKQKRK